MVGQARQPLRRIIIFQNSDWNGGSVNKCVIEGNFYKILEAELSSVDYLKCKRPATIVLRHWYMQNIIYSPSMEADFLSRGGISGSCIEKYVICEKKNLETVLTFNSL
jgi:hypothetical protein